MRASVDFEVSIFNQSSNLVLTTDLKNHRRSTTVSIETYPFFQSITWHSDNRDLEQTTAMG